MNLRRIVFILTAIIMIGMLLLLIQGDFIRQSIAVPLSYAFWIGILILRAVPQVVFWVLLILIGLRIAGDSLFSNPRVLQYQKLPVEYSKRDRVDFWLAQIYRPNGIYAVIRFGEFFKRLILEVLAHQYRMGPSQVETLLRNKTLEVPPELYAYVTKEEFHESPGFPNLLSRLKQFILEPGSPRAQELTGRKDRASLTPPAPGGALESIIQFMEGQLEIKHDHRHP
jgi:hypothetical protein